MRQSKEHESGFRNSPLASSKGGIAGVLQHMPRPVLYAILILVWGMVWPLTKIALVWSPPLLFAGLLVMVSSIALLPWTLSGLSWHRIAMNLALGVLNVGLFFGLQTLALQHESPGLVSLLVYIQPVVTTILARIWLSEALGIRKIVGVVLGFAGVGIISLGHLGLSEAGGLDVLWGLAAGVSWATGTLLYKKTVRPARPLQDIGIQMSVGGLLLIGWGSSLEPWRTIHWSIPFLADLVFVALAGTAVAWVIWAVLLQSGEASRVAMWTFVVPVLSTVLSIWWLREVVTVKLLWGGISVLCGVVLVNSRIHKGGARIG